MNNLRLILLSLLIFSQQTVFCGKKDRPQKSKAALELAKQRAESAQGKELQQKFQDQKKEKRAEEGRDLDRNAQVSSMTAKGTPSRKYMERLLREGKQGSVHAACLAEDNNAHTQRTRRFGTQLVSELRSSFGDGPQILSSREESVAPQIDPLELARLVAAFHQTNQGASRAE